MYIPGHVIQVAQGTTTTQTSATGSTYVDTTLTASITPTSSSSKILIVASQQMSSNNGVLLALGNYLSFNERVYRNLRKSAFSVAI